MQSVDLGLALLQIAFAEGGIGIGSFVAPLVYLRIYFCTMIKRAAAAGRNRVGKLIELPLACR